LCHFKADLRAINAVEFLGWLKKFGPSQNIFGPVKGQGISDVWELACTQSKYLNPVYLST
jgi:hypothetical protein